MTTEERKVDDENWNSLPEFNNFVSSRFRSFSKVPAEENQQLMDEYQIPTWSDSEWNSTKKDGLCPIFSNFSHHLQQLP